MRAIGQLLINCGPVCSREDGHPQESQDHALHCLKQLNAWLFATWPWETNTAMWWCWAGEERMDEEKARSKGPQDRGEDR